MKLCKICIYWFLLMFVGFLIPPYIFPYVPIVFFAEWGLEWQQSAFARAFSVGVMSALGAGAWHYLKKDKG